MPDPDTIRVTVIYAEPQRVFTAAVVLAASATVADAIVASGLREVRPDVQVDPMRVGIFARKVAPQTRLRDGDRVEIYRPLKLDPMEARRRRARRR
ncbi:MAG TPA: RnfH family protein [Rhodanobacteraceae bacterium]|nr:RnfH family protein [Rhodanobacteraceae bacterium]